MLLSAIEKRNKQKYRQKFYKLKKLVKAMNIYLGNSKKEKTHDKFDMER